MRRERPDAGAIERLLDAMERQQHAKLLALARERVPSLTEDDLKNLDDFRELHHDVRLQYEDGMLAGIRAVATAIRALGRGGPGAPD